jgi:hypothetical protein
MAKSARSIGVALVVLLCALGFAGVASSATPRKADKHDRALIKKLLAAQLQEPGLETDAELAALVQACPAAQGVDPLSLLPHLVYPGVFRAIDRLEPALLSYQRMLGTIRPHAPVFKQWIAMKRTETADILKFVQRFDAARMDICAYVEAAIAAGQDEAAQGAALLRLFPHQDDLVALIVFGDSTDSAEAARKALNTRFATFLKASRYTKAQIAALTG